MKKYLYFFKMIVIDRLEQRQELIMSVLTAVVIFAGYAALWGFIYRDRKEIAGYTYDDMLVYYLIIRVITDVVNSMVVFRISQRIFDGRVSNLMIKPLNLQFLFLVEEIARIFADLFIKMLIFIILFLLFFNDADIELTNLPVFVLLISVAMVLSFSIYYIVSALSFWLDPAGIVSVNFGIRRIIFFLSGGIIPIIFFPGFLQNILKKLPFSFLVQKPVDVLLGKVSQAEINNLFVISIVWVLFLWFLGKLVFHISYKHNESVGI